MSKAVPCPGCGATLDYDSIPGYSQAKQRPGKYCPHSGCGHPLDESSAALDHVDYGADTKQANADRAAKAAAFYAAATAE